MSLSAALTNLTHEITIILIGAAAFAEVGGHTGMDPEDVIVLWCIVGGCMGAFCSLHFFRVTPGKTLSSDVAWQFVVNLILSGVFSPLLVPYAVRWSGLRPMQVAVAISCAVGVVAQQLVARIILPWGQRILESRAAKVAADLGVKDEAKP